jgi:molybdenum cofactor guanylyltransferase
MGFGGAAPGSERLAVDGMAVAGVVLCGGASRRMGRDKTLIEVDGQPMAARVAAALTAAGCRPVVAVGGDAVALRACGLDVLADELPGEGPLGGILTALHWAPTEAVFIAAADLPWLDAATVGAVIAAGPVAVAVTDRLEPLCACWSRSSAGLLAEQLVAGLRSVRGALDLLAPVHVRVAWEPLRNVNTPDDLRG